MPQAVLILIGIIAIPSLYAWCNIIAFWNPYGNTHDVKVAVVNLDEGASSSLTGDLDIGSQVVSELRKNDQLGWRFLDSDTAMTAVKSGEVYAAIVIPREFSSDLLSLTTGNFVRPELEYFVNEKANAIAPKITDVGATTLETQINSTFVATVSETVSEALEKTGRDTDARLITARDGSLGAIDQASARVASARAGLNNVETSLSSGETAMGGARSALTELDSVVTQVQSAIADADAVVTEVQSDLSGFTGQVTQSYTDGSAQLVEISAKLNDNLSTLAGKANQANAQLRTAIDGAQAVADAQLAVIEQLIQARDRIGDPSDPLYERLDTAITDLQNRQDADAALVQQLQRLNTDVSGVTTSIQSSADAINSAVRDTASTAGAIRDVMARTLPEITNSMSALSASAGGFSAALDSQRSLIAESLGLIGSLESQLQQARAAGEALDLTLAGVTQNLDGVRSDVSALSGAKLLKQVRELSGLDPEEVAEFMASPVEVQEQVIFPVAPYGSAMAPLFTNLSLWIAAFVLVVLLRQEVDTEGVEGITVRQAYFGRWMLLATINFFQALLVSVGNIVIGVQTVSAIAFVATCVFIGFVYMAVIYALSLSFGYVGKGIVILLVIMQIPGASGIYPIEMMPGFFRALSPFLPFTYGINALRETIGGFYEGDYLKFVSVLSLFAVLAFLLGIFFRQRLGNFARLFNRKLGETQLFSSENVQVLGSRRRVTQIMQALTNGDTFREKAARQAAWVDEHYRTVLRITGVGAIACTALLAVSAGVFPEAKTTILALWGLLCLLVIAVVVTLEYVKQSMAFGAQIGKLEQRELQARLAREEQATHSNSSLEHLKERG